MFTRYVCLCSSDPNRYVAAAELATPTPSPTIPTGDQEMRDDRQITYCTYVKPLLLQIRTTPLP